MYVTTDMHKVFIILYRYSFISRFKQSACSVNPIIESLCVTITDSLAEKSSGHFPILLNENMKVGWH